MSGLRKRERLPPYYYASEQSRALIDTMEKASLKAKAALEDVMAQFFVDTATWGLALWEQQVGIEVDHTRPLAARRSAIEQKLVSSGNTNAEMIRTLAETLTGYQARVTVQKDYSFTLDFLGERSQLAVIDTEEIQTIVDAIQPAHLRFVISELTWYAMKSVDLTWAMLEEMDATWESMENLTPVYGPGDI